MKMTYDDYISNPMGRKSAVISNREMYRSLYKEKLDKILVREIGVVNYTLYNDKDNVYYVHFKIPSEVIPKFYYDVVIEFYTDKNELKPTRSLKDYYVRFYSNDPAFVYTFAHAFLKNKLFIKDLVPRMSKEAVKKAAVDRNPTNQVGYVKSIYFAYLLINKHGLMNKVKYESYGRKYDKKMLLREVMNAEEKIKARQDEDARIRAEKKREKDHKKKLTVDQINRKNKANIKKAVNSTTRAKTITGTKSSNKAKRAKRI